MPRHGQQSTANFFSERKTDLLKHRPACIQCRANVNVTLTRSEVQPARWWCCKCKHEFVWEPVRAR